MLTTSPGPELRYDVRVDATPDVVPLIRRAITRFAAQGDVGRQADIALAVSEALTNAVQHAYRDGASGEVRIVDFMNEAHVVTS
jgi:anti-sigma regulatory factor (Ser/Thr protein kinase)